MAVLSALGFSTLGIWGKLAAQTGLNPHAALSWRFLIVAAVLLPLSARGVSGPARLNMLKVGLLFSLTTTLYFAALARISAGTTSLLIYLSPAFVILLKWLSGQRPSRAQLGAVALAAAGLALIVGLPGPADRDGLGLLCGAAAGTVYAGYLLGNERLLRGLPALSITAHVTLTAGLYFLASSLLTHQAQMPVRPAHWGAVLGLAGVATLLPIPALFAAIQRLGATNASLIATLEPLFAVLLAAVVLHEPLRPTLLAGGACILGGALLSQRRS